MSSKTVFITVNGVELIVAYNYTPAIPGRLDGAWEDSYPDEEAKIELLSILSGDDLVDILCEKVLIEIEQKILDRESE